MVMHNTLVASDYGLLDENTFEPKPNYWGALLWRRFMGTTVLDAGIRTNPGSTCTHSAYAARRAGSRCWRSTRTRRRRTRSRFPSPDSATPCRRTVLTVTRVQLNGTELALGAADAIPAFEGAAIAAGNVTLAPTTITFVTIPTAGNGVCR